MTEKTFLSALCTYKRHKQKMIELSDTNEKMV